MAFLRVNLEYMSIFLWVFLFGGGTIITDFLRQTHKERMKKLDLRERELKVREQELEVMKLYALDYNKARNIVTERLINSAKGEEILIENQSQQDAMTDIDEYRSL
jgi:hypothetical protein